MVIQAPIARPWDRNSGVVCCETCNGDGIVHAPSRVTFYDPYATKPCPDCDGEHLPECEVCGCQIVVPGYDCIACYIVGELPVSHLDAKSIDQLAVAMKAAAGARIVGGGK